MAGCDANVAVNVWFWTLPLNVSTFGSVGPYGFAPALVSAVCASVASLFASDHV